MKIVNFIVLIIGFIYENIIDSIRKLVYICYKIINKRIDHHRGRYQRQNSLTDLHEAVLKNCEKSVKYSIACGVPIDLVDHAGQTALYYACERGYTELVKLLLENGASHHITDFNKTSPLSIAAKEGHSDIVLNLLMNGADPNAKAHDGTTALYQSSYEGHTDCVYHLVSYKCCVNSAKNSGASPLFVAARNGHDRIVECLLKHGADPSQSQRDFRSPLHTALLYNRTGCVELLLQSNVDRLLEQSDIYGWSHLHFLAKKGSMKTAQFFFDYLENVGKSIDLNQKDNFGNTALHIAMFNKKMEFADYLINKGLNINEPNSFGWTYQNYLSKSEEKSKINEVLSPKKYFQSLLSTYQINLTPEVELMRHEVEGYVNELVSYVGKLNPLFLNNIIESGSYYEGTRVGLPDEFDYMINLIEIERLSIFIENNFDPSGYGRLYPKDTNESHQKLFSYLEPITQCISSEKIRKQFYQLLTSARTHVIRKEISLKFQHLKFEWTSGDKRCGTAIHAEWYGTQYPCLTIKIDVVPCLTRFSWPKSANIQCPLEKEEFQIIARSPNIDQTYLWRISTSRAELKDFHSLISEQKNGYLILKTLRMLNPYECIIDKVQYIADDLITSYMFKNEFLHEIKRYPYSQQWKNGSLIHRVLTILKHLHQHLLIGSIKSFYIKNYNVIDTNDYQRFRSNEIKYIRILIYQITQKVKEMNNKPRRRNTFTANQSITHKHIIRERAATTEQ
jgi:ankyrin repeat protein